MNWHIALEDGAGVAGGGAGLPDSTGGTPFHRILRFHHNPCYGLTRPESRCKSTTSGKWSDARRASREWTIRACRTRTGPRTNSLSSEPSGSQAGKLRNREIGAVASRKPRSPSMPRASVLRQSFVVADDHRRQMGRLLKQMMPQQMLDLPMPLALVQPQMQIDQMQRPLGRFDDGQLRRRAAFCVFNRSEI